MENEALIESHSDAEDISYLSPIRERLHLDFLDGIRALAALYVVAYHYQLGMSGVGWASLTTFWLKAGHQAVDVFIVLSGFCLVIPVARSGCLKGGPMLFYARRARRILPPFYVAVLLSFIVHAIFQDVGQHPNHISIGVILTNVLLLQDVFANNTINPVFWSVALECKIYLVFPFLIWLLLRKGPVPTLGMAALLSYGTTFLLSWRNVPMQEFYPWYLFLFTTGVIAGWLALKPSPREALIADKLPQKDQMSHVSQTLYQLKRLMAFGIGIVLIVTLLLKAHIVSAGPYRHMPQIDGAIGIVTATVLALLALVPLKINWMLSKLQLLLAWRPLVVIGSFAYSIYLIHVPLQDIQYRLLGEAKAHSFIHGALLNFGLGLPVIIGLSYLFFVVFERPFLNAHTRQTLSQTAQEAVISPAP